MRTPRRSERCCARALSLPVWAPTAQIRRIPAQICFKSKASLTRWGMRAGSACASRQTRTHRTAPSGVPRHRQPNLGNTTGRIGHATPTMAKHSRTWVVRAGKSATFIDDFRTNSVVAIGWHETGPISPTASDDTLTALFDRTCPTAKPGTRRVWQAQVRRFPTEIHPGDHVATYDPNSRLYLLGTVDGQPEPLSWPSPASRCVSPLFRSGSSRRFDQRSRNSTMFRAQGLSLLNLADRP